MTKDKEAIRVIATNRKAYHDYHLEQTFEAGIALTGSEIKSVRAGRVNLRDSFVLIRNGEAWLVDAHIAQYEQASRDNHEPKRDRKLLLHKQEIARLASRVQEKGYTIVPLRMYLKGNLAKVEIALARGKRLYDKREAIAQRDSEREMEREWREATRRRDW
ncbi:MAG: SsrA-binding protein SmpB [Anaerolineae bacterium]|nr:SsrA-binding protein SmpB [Anaerolineae bacterium]